MTAITADAPSSASLPGESDLGLFGPDSVAWELWGHPAALIGLARSFVIEMLNPLGAAALAEHSAYREDPLGRLRRTMDYFLTIVYGDRRQVAEANARIARVHRRVHGVDPVTGRRYSGSDAFMQLGTNMETWHSVFHAYRVLVAPLSPEQEGRFFAESALVSDAMGITPQAVRDAAAAAGHDLQLDAIPDSRDAYRAVTEQLNPTFANTAAGREVIAAILLHSTPPGDVGLYALAHALRPLMRATVALIPLELRRLAGLPTSRVGDMIAITAARPALAAARLPGARSVFELASPAGYALRREALARTTA